MDRSQKEKLVQSLREIFENAALVVVTQQVGLTVAESTELRRRMREAGASYRVTKNRLVRLALDGTKFDGLEPFFAGPTAIAHSDDPVAAAKVAVEFAAGNDKLTVIAGALDGEVLELERIRELAKLPSLDEQRAMLIALFQTPATRIAGVLQAPAGQLARVMGAYGATGEAA